MAIELLFSLLVLLSLNSDGLSGRGRSHETGRSDKGALEISSGGLAEEVDLEDLRVVESLDRHDSLDEQRLSVLHVTVHEAHLYVIGRVSAI